MSVKLIQEYLLERREWHRCTVSSEKSFCWHQNTVLHMKHTAKHVSSQITGKKRTEASVYPRQAVVCFVRWVTLFSGWSKHHSVFPGGEKDCVRKQPDLLTADSCSCRQKETLMMCNPGAGCSHRKQVSPRRFRGKWCWSSQVTDRLRPIAQPPHKRLCAFVCLSVPFLWTQRRIEEMLFYRTHK